MARKKRYGLRRGRKGRFVSSKSHRRVKHNPIRRRRSHKRNPRRTSRSFFHKVMHRSRRNPLGFPDFQTIGGIAVGAIIVRAITPRVTSLIPGAAGTFLRAGWGSVLSTVVVGGGISWAAAKFLGAKWGSACMAGTIAVAGVQAADLVIPKLPAPVNADEISADEISAYDQPTQLADGTTISAGEEINTVGSYMGPGY